MAERLRQIYMMSIENKKIIPKPVFNTNQSVYVAYPKILTYTMGIGSNSSHEALSP